MVGVRVNDIGEENFSYELFSILTPSCPKCGFSKNNDFYLSPEN
jgi:hypothetical protein